MSTMTANRPHGALYATHSHQPPAPGWAHQPARNGGQQPQRVAGEATAGGGQAPKPRQRKRQKPTEELRGFMRRMLRAYGRRAAEEDPWVVKDMLAVRAELDTQIAGAVLSLRQRGYSWADIAYELGETKNAVYKRWGHLEGSER